jgi:hypothetical protein
MSRNIGIFLLAAILSGLWYISLGYADSAAITDQENSIVSVCLHNRPEGSIHTPEGGSSPPRSEYTYFPLGLECEFAMTDGSTQISKFSKYGLTIGAALPMVSTVLWFSLIVARHRRSKGFRTAAR